MVEYSHFARSAPCASPGYYCGAKGGEVQIADTSGNLFQAGTQITGTATQLNRTIGGTTSGFRIAAGTVSCSPSATVDTGLTTVTHAVTGIVGKAPNTNGTTGTLDTINTPDAVINSRESSAIQHRIVSTNDLWIKCYQNTVGGAEATLDSSQKKTNVSWIAFGT